MIDDAPATRHVCECLSWARVKHACGAVVCALYEMWRWAGALCVPTGTLRRSGVLSAAGRRGQAGTGSADRDRKRRREARLLMRLLRSSAPGPPRAGSSRGAWPRRVRVAVRVTRLSGSREAARDVRSSLASSIFPTPRQTSGAAGRAHTGSTILLYPLYHFMRYI